MLVEWMQACGAQSEVLRHLFSAWRQTGEWLGVIHQILVARMVFFM
jgi:hypothetical protein